MTSSSTNNSWSESTQLVVNDIGQLRVNDLRQYFSQFGSVRSRNISIKKTTRTSTQGGSFNFAFVRFDAQEACTAAMSSAIHDIHGRRCNVAVPNVQKLRAETNISGAAASSIDADFALFGTFPDYEGFRYLLDNKKFGRVGDYATNVYMEQSQDIPNTISDDDSVLDALVAAEEQTALVTKFEESGNLEQANVHRGVHISLLAAVQQYSHHVDIDAPIIWQKIAFVKNAPISTTFRQIREKFYGRVHDAWFQRRGAPDLSRRPGYFVVFSTVEDAEKASGGYREDGTTVIPGDPSNWWHKTFWHFFIRRSLHITATLSNTGLAASCWRSSEHREDRAYAIAKVYATRKASQDSDGATVENADSKEGEEEDLPDVIRPHEEDEQQLRLQDDHGHRHEAATAPVSLSWEEQMKRFDLDPYFEDQYEYLAFLDRCRKNPKRKKNAVNVREASMKFHLGLCFYQLYASDTFLKPCGFGSKSNIDKKLSKLRDCDRVSYGYVLQQCDYWLEKDARNRYQIRQFLSVTDKMYHASERFGAPLLEVFDGRHPQISRDDDCQRYADADDVLAMPADFSYELIETSAGLSRVVEHVLGLTNRDSVAFDTEGHSDAYTSATVQTIQLATSQKKAYVIDMQYCVGLPEMGKLGQALKLRVPLYFGQNFHDADSIAFFAMLDLELFAIPVHEIGRMILKVKGMDGFTATHPSLASFTEHVLSKRLAKDAQMSGWSKRRRFPDANNHLTNRQVLYAALDVVAIILILNNCEATFPLRFRRYSDNFHMLNYSPKFEYKDWNETDPDRLDLPEPLSEDDTSYSGRS